MRGNEDIRVYREEVEQNNCAEVEENGVEGGGAGLRGGEDIQVCGQQ